MKNGFTLIELMIVVAILAILAAITIPAYQSYLCESKPEQCKAKNPEQYEKIFPYGHIDRWEKQRIRENTPKKEFTVTLEQKEDGLYACTPAGKCYKVKQ